MKERIMLLLTVLFFSIGFATAQNRTISGTVVSSEDNQPIIGASVLVKGTTIGTVTDANGKFTVRGIPASAKLFEVSYIGMKKKEVEIKPNLRVVLEPQTTEVDEVVVVAYGTAKKESLVGAQANVSAKQLEKRPLTNLTSALSGLSSGVQSITNTGQPGSSASIMIRGFGSVNASSAPLYVVDGAIYNGALSDIAPSDIQSISILKDAASTALYGSSAGNGVVLITTKSGAKGVKNKPHFTLTVNQGFTQKGQKDYKKVSAREYFPMRWQQWYNQYVHQYKAPAKDAGIQANMDVLEDAILQYMPFSGIKTGYEYDPAIDDYKQVPYVQGKNYPMVVTPEGKLNPEIDGLLWCDDLDWEGDLFRKGYRSEYTLSGGMRTDKMESFMSLGYLKEQGYRIRTSFERFSGRANVSYDLNKYIKTGTNISFSRVHNEAPKRADGSYSSNSFYFVRGIAPFYPIHRHNPDGSYVLNDGEKVYDHSQARPYNGRFNPVEESYLDLSSFDRDAITDRSFIEVSFLPELKFRMNLSYDLSRAQSKMRYNNVMGDQPMGMLIMEDNRYSIITYNQLLTYNKTFGKHGFDALLGHESYWWKRSFSYMDKSNMGVMGLDEMPNFSVAGDMDSATDTYTKEGYFGRLNYNYDSKYNASFSYRRDGTSRLAKDNRWGNFWSVGLGWNISREEFMKDLTWLNYLKLRASIGQTGNDAIGSYYAYMSLYGLGTNNYENLGARFQSIGNPDLLWETQTSYDVAVEFGIFNRLRGTIEFFNKESSDLIFAFPLPASTGIGSINKNIGKIRNYGLEFDLKADLIQSKNFNWTFNLNGTYLKNELVRLPDANRKDGIELSYHKYMEGRSIYDYYLNEWIGVNPETGMAMYRIDNEQYPEQADPKNPAFVGVAKEGEAATWTEDGRFAKKHFCGSSIPKLYGGFGTGFNLYGVNLDLAFAYQLGGKTYDGGYQGLMGRRLNAGAAAHKDMLKAWMKPGQKTDVPRLDAGQGGQYDNMTSDRFLTSSTALMLKSIVLGYTIPTKYTKYLGMEGVNVSLAAENLFLLSKRRGMNPMMSFGGTVGAAFYDYAKTLTASVSFRF